MLVAFMWLLALAGRLNHDVRAYCRCFKYDEVKSISECLVDAQREAPDVRAAYFSSR